MRFHEVLMCVAALLAPFIAFAITPTWWWMPLIVFACVSLPLLWLTGYLIDHTYG